MIKTIVSDIDGVLVSTKELHESAFLSALSQHGYEVGVEQHKRELDGLPTRTKLHKLGICTEKHASISELKQQLTFERAPRYLRHDPALCSMFWRLKADGYNLAIASNCIRPFCDLVVKSLLLPVDLVISNDEAKPKPAPDMYLKAMAHFGSLAHETVVCEDSNYGLQAAFASGARVFYVPDPSYMTYDRLNRFLMVV